jgi:glycosyltransferase involved in cell wall biosynthesis
MENVQRKLALVCFSYSLGGLELSTLRLAKAMNGKGISTIVIVPPFSPMHKRALDTFIPCVTTAPRWKYGDIFASVRLARILRDNQVSIAVLTQSQDLHLAALASMFYSNSKFVFYQQMNSRHNKRDLIHSWVYSKLSLWISLTQNMKNDVVSFTRVPQEKIKVVPLGTDLDLFDPSHYKKSEAREFFDLPKNRRIVGVLGRLDAQKGQEVLLRAVPKVVTHHPDVLFLVAGDETAGEPGYKEYLKTLVEKLEIERFVRFFPFTDDVPRLMAALDVFTLPSFSETFGLVVVEAMAMERPIIATNAGGLPEIITNGKTGLLIKPRDSNAVARAIHRILSDAALRSSLARSAREEALRRYSFDNCVDNLLGSLSAI